jgi:hypothetical protein
MLASALTGGGEEKKMQIPEKKHELKEGLLNQVN